MASVSRTLARAASWGLFIWASHASLGWAASASAMLSVSATVSAYCTFNEPARSARIDAKCSTPPSSIDLRYLVSAKLNTIQAGLVPSIEYEKLPQVQSEQADILMVTVIY